MPALYYEITDQRGFFNEIDAGVFIKFTHNRETHYAPLFAFRRALDTTDLGFDNRCLLSKHKKSSERIISRLIAGDPLTYDDTYCLFGLAMPLISRNQDHANMKPVLDLYTAFDEMAAACSLRMSIQRTTDMDPLREFFRQELSPFFNKLPVSSNVLPSTSL